MCILHMMPQSMVSSSQGSAVALFLIPSRQIDDFFALAVHAACRAQRPSAEEVLKERDPHGLKPLLTNPRIPMCGAVAIEATSLCVVVFTIASSRLNVPCCRLCELSARPRCGCYQGKSGRRADIASL